MLYRPSGVLVPMVANLPTACAVFNRRARSTAAVGCSAHVRNSKLWLPTFLLFLAIIYFGHHEAICVPGIPGSRHFVSARRPVGIHYVRLAGDTLLSG